MKASNKQIYWSIVLSMLILYISINDSSIVVHHPLMNWSEKFPFLGFLSYHGTTLKVSFFLEKNKGETVPSIHFLCIVATLVLWNQLRHETKIVWPGFLWSLAVSLGKTPNTVGVCVCVSLPRRIHVVYLIYSVIHQELIPVITCFLLACTTFVLSFECLRRFHHLSEN